LLVMSPYHDGLGLNRRKPNTRTICVNDFDRSELDASASRRACFRFPRQAIEPTAGER
jgi:hypothetical protein